MRHRLMCLALFICCLFSGISYAYPDTGIATGSNPQLEKVEDIFNRNCVRCHSGLMPAQELNLGPGNIISSTVDVTSMQKIDLRIVDTANPRMSYLLKKIKGDSDITGKRMPLKGGALNEEDIKAVEEWIVSLKGTSGKESGQRLESAKKPAENAFRGTRLINLSTPTIIPGGHFLFRISHRFINSVKDGYDSFFGLDGPAVIFLGMGYGISRSLDITIGRSNLLQEFELMLKWRVRTPSRASTFPLSIALHAGGSWVTETIPGESAFDSDNLKFNLQLCLAYPLSRKIALLAVPGDSSNVDHFEPDPEGTFSLGTGIRIDLMRNFSVIGEWLPVLSGYKANANGWGLGFEYKIGKHLFQVFALNSAGITLDRFISGGDLLLGKGHFRFGFNIFREF